MIRKILLLTVAAILCLSMIACAVQEPTTPENGGETPPIENEQTPTTEGEEEQESSGGEEQKPPSEEEETPSTENNPKWLNVATYNILHGANQADPDLKNKHGAADLDNHVNLILDNEIDIIGLNEVDINCSRSIGALGSEYREEYMSNQPKYVAETLTERTGQEYYWAFAYSIKNADKIPYAHEGDALYGNAIISRYPIISTRSFKVYCHNYDPSDPNTQFGYWLGGGNYYEVKTVLIAEIDVDGKVVTVIVSHFGLADAERALMTEMLLEEIGKVDTPVILLGDFNSGPGDANIQKLDAILNPAGGAEDRGATHESGNRIDWIYTSDDFEMKDYAVLGEIGYSDHYPVTVQVSFKE